MNAVIRDGLADAGVVSIIHPKRERPMKTRVKMLKVKIKSLAAEARIIRLEEKRSEPGSRQQCELHEHRVNDVRDEQRCSLLAYAFIRGKSMKACEARSKTQPDWKRIGEIVKKFGAASYSELKDQGARFSEWQAAHHTA